MSLPYLSNANLPFSSTLLNINGVNYRALSWNPKKNSRKIRRDDINGDQAEFEIRKEPATWSGTLQKPLTTTAVPTQGLTFVDPDDANTTFVITSVTPVKPLGEFHTIDIDTEEVMTASANP